MHFFKVNNTDNNGIVYGNWSGDYYGGKNPSEWIGSPKILRKFYQTQKPVKYGHSSIIAGIATTGELQILIMTVSISVNWSNDFLSKK